MNHLLRSLAPITQAGWDLLDKEARERLIAALTARKLVDFSDAHGWGHSATNLGHTEAINQTPAKALDARSRRVLPAVELRARFSVSRDELRDGDRGAADVDLTNLDEAAKRMALAKIAIFQAQLS